jgi:SAM-dependent methyltransferase
MKAPALRVSAIVTFAFFGTLAAIAFYLARRDWPVAIAGAGLGWLGRMVWSWGWLEFLDEPSPWRALKWELANFRNVISANRRDRWEAMYAGGGYGQLVATAPEPRHYLFAGMIRNRFPDGANILDVGCGFGMLYPLVAGPGFSYVGIDVIDPMIAHCREKLRNGVQAVFKTCGFEEFETADRFDAVVFGEILYYFPPAVAERHFRRALALLRNERSIVLVSMGTKANLRARRIWRLLESLSTPLQSVQMVAPESGSLKTVRVFSVAADSRPKGNQA